MLCYFQFLHRLARFILARNHIIQTLVIRPLQKLNLHFMLRSNFKFYESWFIHFFKGTIDTRLHVSHASPLPSLRHHCKNILNELRSPKHVFLLKTRGTFLLINYMLYSLETGHKSKNENTPLHHTTTYYLVP